MTCEIVWNTSATGRRPEAGGSEARETVATPSWTRPAATDTILGHIPRGLHPSPARRSGGPLIAIAEALITVEQFGRRPDPGHPEELVRGRIIALPPPSHRHGQVCNKAGRIFGNFVEEHDLGHVLSNDSGVVTEHGPDTVRGADIAYYSYARLPRGPLPVGYGPEIPELVVEVRSESERWPKVLAKVAEYLDAGVLVVCVLDPKSESAHLFPADGPVRVLSAEDELTVPDVLGDFRVAVRRFFE